MMAAAMLMCEAGTVTAMAAEETQAVSEPQEIQQAPETEELQAAPEEIVQELTTDSNAGRVDTDDTTSIAENADTSVSAETSLADTLGANSEGNMDVIPEDHAEEQVVGGPLDGSDSAENDENGLYEAGLANYYVENSTVNAQNYGDWGKTVKSYIIPKANGARTILRYDGTKHARGILISEINANGVNTAERSIPVEGGIFGGFYAGSRYNFVVSGNSNTSESDSTAVMIITKYSKDWQKLASQTCYGWNTYLPFEAGSCRMAERSGLLYVDTCHEMYTYSDGLNHQANMLFVLNESSMAILDKRYEVSNNGTGYVSHSFNQFVRVGNGRVYTVDHGDGHPRNIFLASVKEGTVSTDIRYSTLMDSVIPGSVGQNYTGVNLGGFELSTDNALTAYSSADLSHEIYKKDVYVAVTSLSGLNGGNTRTDIRGITRTIRITNDASHSTGTPQLVRLSNNRFLLMWTTDNSTTQFQYTFIDGSGNWNGSIQTASGSLSDCQPVWNGSAGVVQWFVYDGASTVLFNLNPDTGNLTKQNAGPYKVLTDTEITRYVTASKWVAAAGETVSITPYEPDVYGLETVTAKAEDGSNVPVTANADGSFTLKMPVQDITLSATLRKRVQYVRITNSTSLVHRGQSYQFSAAVVPEDVRERGITWSSSNPSVATVDADGTVHGLKDGNATITATARDNGKSVSREITVQTIQIQNIYMTYSRYLIYTGLKMQMACKFYPENASGDLTWTSANTGIAVVDAKGMVTGIAPGVTTISVRANDTGASATCQITVQQNPNPVTFGDVDDPGRWYYQPVYWAVRKGITNGVGNGAFGPNQTCTRAQAMTFLWRASGSPRAYSQQGFSDVNPTSWYANPVSWAVEQGITNGVGGGRFGSNEGCTRAQIVTFLWKAMGSYDYGRGSAGFTDVPADKWYSKAVDWAVQRGVTNGIGGGKFGPEQTCTRAQIMTFLYKIYG